MKMFFQILLLAIVAISVAACGTSVPPKTQELTIGRGDEITFKAIGGQQGPVEVKIVFTTFSEGGEIYFQSFSDGELMHGDQRVYEDLDLFPGLSLHPEDPPQLTVEYNPSLWEVVP